MLKQDGGKNQSPGEKKNEVNLILNWEAVFILNNLHTWNLQLKKVIWFLLSTKEAASLGEVVSSWRFAQQLDNLISKYYNKVREYTQNMKIY